MSTIGFNPGLTPWPPATISSPTLARLAAGNEFHDVRDTVTEYIERLRRHWHRFETPECSTSSQHRNADGQATGKPLVVISASRALLQSCQDTFCGPGVSFVCNPPSLCDLRAALHPLLPKCQAAPHTPFRHAMTAASVLQNDAQQQEQTSPSGLPHKSALQRTAQCSSEFLDVSTPIATGSCELLRGFSPPETTGGMCSSRSPPDSFLRPAGATASASSVPLVDIHEEEGFYSLETLPAGDKHDQNETPWATPMHSGRILCVDDSPVILRLLSAFISRAGFTGQVDTATSGTEALRMASNTDYILIFTDFNMPTLTGADVTSRLRQMGTSVPIIGVTAATNMREVCLASGMTDVLFKPFTFQAIRTVLAAYLASL